MAKYSENADKILSKAVPTVKADGTVREWELEVVYSYPGEGYTTTDKPMRRRYNEREDVAYLNKPPEQFTKSEILGFMNITQYDLVFDSTYESLNSLATESKEGNFDVNSLAD
jgi:hypothetical protein